MVERIVQCNGKENVYCDVQFRLKQTCGTCRFSRSKCKIKLCLRILLPWIQRDLPLQSLDICRRCRYSVYKLKEDLQDLGLSRRQVHRGLKQLATKPRVVLTRHPICGRYGSKRLPEDERSSSDDIVLNYRANNALDHWRSQYGNLQKPNTTDRITKDDIKRGEKTEGLKICKAEVSIDSNRESCMSRRYCNFENRSLASVHSFDKALEQLDRIVSTRMDPNKSSDRRSSVIVSAGTSSSKPQDKGYVNNSSNKRSVCNKDESQLIHVENENTRLTHDKGDPGVKDMPGEHRKNRIGLNISSWCGKKRANNHMKSDINQKSDSDEKIASTKADFASSKESKQKDDGRALIDTKVLRIEENMHKKMLHKTSNSAQKRRKICSPVDENKEVDIKKSKTIKNKFRIYFGDCISISEDEQEQDILRRRFKTRRKKDSVDSCDSGVLCGIEGNTAITGIEILKDVQKAVPDSTTHEELSESTSNKIAAEANTIDESKDITNNESIEIINQVENIEDESTKLQNDVCKVDDHETKKDKITDEESVSISDENNFVQSTLDATETSSEVERPKTCVSVSQVETSTDNSTLSYNTLQTFSPSHEIVTVEDISESQTNNLDTGDWSELLHMTFNDTCQITTNGNVLSIRENAEKDINQNSLNKDIDENSNLKILSKTQVDSNGNDGEQVLNDIIEDKSIHSEDTDIYCDTQKDITDSIKSNACNTSNNVNDAALPDSELNCATEQMDTVSSKIPQGRLRVLSSSELGSRWCPTPVNVVTTTVSEFSSTNIVRMSDVNLNCSTTTAPLASSRLVTSAVNMTIPIISTSTSASVKTTSSENIRKSHVDTKFSEAVYNTLVRICNLIQSLRSCASISNLDYSKSLHTEFEKLRKILNTEDYVALIDGVINILNKELLEVKPLSLRELFCYIPPFEAFYVRNSQKYISGTINNSAGYQTMIPTVISNKTLNQNIITHNSQALQNVCTTSVQTVLQNVLFISPLQSQAPISIISDQPRQNFREKMVLQPQNNIPISSTGINYSTQQKNYRMQTQRSLSQQKTSNAYFTRQKPPSNIHTLQSYSSQHCAFSSININPPTKHIPVTIANPPFINQQFVPQGIHVSQANTFYNVNAPNYSMWQNINPAQGKNIRNTTVPPMVQPFQNIVYRQRPIYMSQGIQPQTVPQLPQNVPVINYAPQTVQNGFVTNMPQSTIPRSALQNEHIYRKVPLQLPQNGTFEQVPSAQYTQNIFSCKTKQQPIIVAKKKENTTQVSLESTIKQFDILKYLSDIQKLMLLNQMDFYFSCTIWLDQQFTVEQWQIIHSERSFLLHFQTLLKYFVEKTIKDLLPKKSQSSMFENNILTNVKIDVPKTVQIIVQENEQIHRQVDASKAEDEQCKTINSDQSNINQENLNVLILPNHSEKEQKAVDIAQNKQSSNQVVELEILDEEEIQKNKQIEQTLPTRQENQSPVMSIIKTQQTLDGNINQKDTIEEELQISTNLHNLDVNKQNLNESEKITENVPHADKEKVLSVTSDLKVSHIDTLQQSNTHLVTVEISSNNDQVTVINTNEVSGAKDKEIKSVNEKSKETKKSQQEKLHVSATLSCLENETCEISKVLSPKSSGNIELFNNENIDSSLLEETVSSHILDIRSITLEAFENIEENNISTNTDGVIEEEEIKVCLFCGKPSTVACSICLEAKYCSKVCSELHWQEHYKDCKPVEKSMYL